MPNKLKIKRGPNSSIPNGELAEPLFTSDTYDLYIGKGDGTNQRFQKYLASGTTSQYIRGDGSLATHDLDSLTDVVVSSPSNGEILKYNGTNWVNGTGGFITGGGVSTYVAVFDSLYNIVGYNTFIFDQSLDKLSITNGYVNNNLTVDGQLVIKSENGAAAYTRGLKFPDNSYGDTGDIAGLRLTNSGGDNLKLELYCGHDTNDTINFSVAATGSAYNDNVTINGNKIWNAGNLPTPLSSTGTITSGQLAIFSNANTVYSDTELFWDNSLNRLGVGTNSPIAQIGVETSDGVPIFGYRTYGGIFYELIQSFDSSSYGHLIQTGRSGSITTAKNITFLNNNTILSITEDKNIGINTLNPMVNSTSNTTIGLNIYSSLNTVSSGISLTTVSSGTTSGDGARIILRNDGLLFIRNLESGGTTINGGDGNFEIITNAATNFKIDSSTGKIGIGNPASIAEMLTVNGSIQQSTVTSAITKTDSNGKIVAAVAGTDYVAPSALSGYVPTSTTLTINGTAYDLSTNRSWSVGTVLGSGSAGRVAYWSTSTTAASDAGFVYDSATKRFGVNTTVPNATIGATAASGYGFLTKSADSNYNGVGIGFDSVSYGNLIATEKLGTAPAANLTLQNQAGYISITEAGNLGINILSATPSTTGPGGQGIDIYSSTTAALAFHNVSSGTGASAGGRIYYNSKNLIIRNLSAGDINLTADNGTVYILTNGSESLRADAATSKVGIGNPASVAEMLTVNGSIQQSGVTSAMLKANSSGKIIAAVAGTDYQAPLTNPVTGTGTSGYIAKFTSTGSTIGNSLVYDGGSRSVAIGNSSTKAWASPFYVLEGGSYGQFLGFQTNTAAVKMGVNLYFNGANYIYTNSSYGGAILDVNGDATNSQLTFSSAPAGTAGNAATLTTRFQIDAANNVSTINTFLAVGKLYTPTTSLEVFNDDNANTVMQARRKGVGATGVAVMSLAGENYTGVGESKAQIRAVFSSTTSSMDTNMDFHTTTGTTDISSATLRMRIAPTGNIGIGTSSPTAITNYIAQTINGINGSFTEYQQNGSYAFRIGSDNGVGGFLSQTDANPIRIFTNTFERMRITSGGNVGIGTTAPVTNLHLAKGATGLSGLQVTNSTTGSTITDGAFFGIDDNQAYVWNYENNPLVFATNNTERMRITSGGNVLINTTSTNGLRFSERLNVSALNDFGGIAVTTYTGASGSRSSIIDLNKSRGASDGSMTAVANGDQVGYLLFRGSDGTNFIDGAYIRADVDGTVTTNSVPMTMVFQTGPNGSSERMRITSGGSVCINRTSGDGKFNIDGTFYMYNMTSGAGLSTLKYNTSTGAVTYDTSARIFKKDIIDLTYGLDSLMKMNPKKYKWKSNDLFDLGFIADEMYNIIPEVVSLANNSINKTELKDGEPIGINYDRLIPVLVKAIQEQQVQIEELKSKLN